jgi:zinc protease
MRRFFAALALVGGCSSAPEAGVVQAGSPGDDGPIPSDAGLRAGELENGLKYYLRHSDISENRTELRLVVNAGSVLEQDAERGLAHAVEHLAIRGSRRFPERAADRYFDALGMRRGTGINGSTSLDLTTYRMTIPSERFGVMDTALAMLSGIASDAELDAASSRTEGAVIMEEWRSGRDAFQRVADARHDIIFAGTPYAARQPIGTTDVLQRFDLDAIRAFYKRWYRPDLMAVIAVGEFDLDEAEAAIRKHFGGMPRPATPAERPKLEVPARPPQLRAIAVVDSELTATYAGLWFPRRPNVFHTRADYRAALVRWIWIDILQGRLDEAALDPGSPILTASAEHRFLARPLSAYVVSSTALRGRAPEALETLSSEVERLAREGPSEGEVRERRGAILRTLREQREAGESSEGLVAEYVDLFVNGNMPITNAIALDLGQALLPTITLDDVAAFAKTVTTSSDMLAVLTAMADDPAAATTGTELVERAKAGAARRIARAGDSARFSAPAIGATGSIISEDRELNGVVSWRLSNGMRVLAKPSRHSFDQVRFRLLAPGGASLASDAEYASAYYADEVIRRSGVGAMSGGRLMRWLESTSLSISASVADAEITIDAHSGTDDVERMLQLVRTYMDAPRRDTVAFRRFRAQSIERSMNRWRDPDEVFTDSLRMALTRHHPRTLRQTPAFYESMDLDIALRFWKARMANASGMTVAIAGDFTLSQLRPLVEKYLASLPPGRRETAADVGMRYENGLVTRSVRSGQAARARTAITMSGPYTPTNEALNDLSAVRDVVEFALGDRIRETLGGTYNVSVYFAVDLQPPGRYTLTVDFQSSPGRVDELTAVAAAELDRLRTRGPTQAEFAATREMRVRDYDGETERIAYWTEELTAHARLGWPLVTISQHGLQAQMMTLEALKAACATYIDPRRSVRVIMRPGGGATR